MAFRKSISLPNGARGEYIRLGAFTWDRLARQASAHLMLYADASHASCPSAAPLCLIAKLRLAGAKFDAYLSNTVLDAGAATIVGQLYAAAKVEPLIAGGGLPCPALNLPPVDLTDAIDA